MGTAKLSFILAIVTTFVLNVSVYGAIPSNAKIYDDSNGDGYTPYAMEWSQTDRGSYYFSHQENGEGFRIVLYFNGEVINRGDFYTGPLNLYEDTEIGGDFSPYILNEGVYQFTITTYDSNDDDVGETALSREFVLGSLSNLGNAANLNFEIVGNEVWCTWDAPAGFDPDSDEFAVFMASMYDGPSEYSDDPFAGGANVIPEHTSATRCLLPLSDFEDNFEYGTGPYIFSVQAISGNLDARNSSETVYSQVAYDKDQKAVIHWPPAIIDTHEPDPQVIEEAPAVVDGETKTALPTSSAVLINGEEATFQTYNIDGANYFKLRDVAISISGTEKQFGVSWDEANNAIALLSNTAYTVAGGEMEINDSAEKAASPTSSKVIIDDVPIEFTAYNIDGANYFMLRDLGKAFDLDIGWDEGLNTITIVTSESYSG